VNSAYRLPAQIDAERGRQYAPRPATAGYRRTKTRTSERTDGSRVQQLTGYEGILKRRGWRAPVTTGAAARPADNGKAPR
jgi:hypothetical protein